MAKIVLLGGGGHGKVVASVLLRLRDFEFLGYLDPTDQGDLLGRPRLGDDSALPALQKLHPGLLGVIGLGKVDAGSRRFEFFAKWRAAGLSFPALVAPTAYVAAGVTLGEGVVVMDGAIVQPGSRIGAAAILNTRASVDHDCVIGDDVHIAPGATLSGNVSVGEHSLIGVGASVREGTRIGASCLIGAGAAVVDRDLCASAGTYGGVPARRMEK